MKKLALLSMLAFVFCANAEVKTWIGGTDNLWETAANWEPAGVPTENDTAFFDTAATVSLNSAFGGTVQITNDVEVTLDVAVDVAMESMVAKGSTLKKQGTGSLTLSPAEGLNLGTISVLSGNVDFKQNKSGVPSMFGKLVVASGASVNVTDSPADNRHGFLIKYRDIESADSKTTEEYCGEFESTFDAFNKWLTIWKTEEFSTSAYTSTTDYEKPFGCDGNNIPYFLSPYNTKDEKYFYAMGRGVAVLHPESSNQSMLIEGDVDDFGSLFLNGVRKAYKSWEGTFYSNSSGISPGLNDVGFVLVELTQDQYFKIRWYATSNLEGWVYPDTLWNGVCFNGIELNSNATLTIADNQAVGFATIGGDKIEGNVVGGESSFFSLLGGKVALNENEFSNFNGTIEVGRHATVMCEPNDDEATLDKNYLWYGKLLATSGAMWNLAGKNIGEATVEVEEGARVILDLENAIANKIMGEGDLIVNGGTITSDFNTKEFTGNVSLVGTRVEIDNLALIKDRNLKVKCTLDDFTSGMWATNGITVRKADNGRAVVPSKFFDADEPGTLIMTDDIAQKSLAYLTNVTVRLDEPWEVSFTYGAYPLTFLKEDFGYSLTHAEGLAFTITPAKLKGSGFDGSNRAPKYSEGIFFRTYADSPTKRFWWVKKGVPDSANGYTSSQMNDILFTDNPVDVKVVYDGDGAMTVRFSQGDKVWETTRIIHVVKEYKDSEFYFAFVSHTGFWSEENAIRPGSYHKVWNFSGTVYEYADVEGTEQDSFALREENWVLASNKDAHTLENGKLTMPTNTHGKYFAQCKTPLKYSDMWKATFTYEITANQNTGGEGFAIFVQTNNPTSLKVSEGGLFAQPNGSYGIGFYPWGNKIQWITNKTLGDRLATNLEVDKDGKNKPIDVTIFYDGAGRMEFVLNQAGVANETWVYNIPDDAFDVDQDVYFGFSYAASSWACYIQNTIYDFKFEKYESVPLVTIEDELIVSAGGNVTLAVGHVGSQNEENVVYPSVKLEAGATLTITNINAINTYHIRLDEVKFPSSGAGTIFSKEGITEISRLVLSGNAPGAHKLSGRFAAPNGIEVVIPSAWKNLPMPLILVDVSEVVWEGGEIPQVTLIDEDGNLIGNVKVSASNGSIRINKAGCVIIIR